MTYLWHLRPGRRLFTIWKLPVLYTVCILTRLPILSCFCIVKLARKKHAKRHGHVIACPICRDAFVGSGDDWSPIVKSAFLIIPQLLFVSGQSQTTPSWTAPRQKSHLVPIWATGVSCLFPIWKGETCLSANRLGCQRILPLPYTSVGKMGIFGKREKLFASDKRPARTSIALWEGLAKSQKEPIFLDFWL